MSSFSFSVFSQSSLLCRQFMLRLTKADKLAHVRGVFKAVNLLPASSHIQWQSRDWVVLDTNKCTKIKHRKTLCAVSTLQSVKTALTVLRCFVNVCHLQITGPVWPKSRCFHKLSHHDPDTWGITHPGPEVTMAEPGQCPPPRPPHQRHCHRRYCSLPPLHTGKPFNIRNYS